MSLAKRGAGLIALIKPQFEVGRDGLDKGGIVKNEELRLSVIEDIKALISAQGWELHGTITSPITGPDGNIEYLIGATKR